MAQLFSTFTSVVRIRGPAQPGEKEWFWEGEGPPPYDQLISINQSGADILALLIPHLDAFVCGRHLSIVVFGGTGSGKTFTLEELVPPAIEYVFSRLQDQEAKATVQCFLYSCGDTVASNKKKNVVPVEVDSPKKARQEWIKGGKGRSADNGKNSNSSRNIYEFRLEVNDFRLAIYDLPGKECSGKKERSWINLGYAAMQSMLECIRKRQKIDFESMARNYRSYPGQLSLIESIVQNGAMCFGIACIAGTNADSTEKERTKGTLHLSQSFRQIRVVPKVKTNSVIIPRANFSTCCADRDGMVARYEATISDLKEQLAMMIQKTASMTALPLSPKLPIIPVAGGIVEDIDDQKDEKLLFETTAPFDISILSDFRAREMPKSSQSNVYEQILERLLVTNPAMMDKVNKFREQLDPHPELLERLVDDVRRHLEIEACKVFDEFAA